MRIRSLLAHAVLVLLPLMASAQQIPAEGVTLVGPGKFAGVFEETATLTVESIDKATRSVVLQRANGEMLRMVAGNEVQTSPNQADPRGLFLTLFSNKTLKSVIVSITNQQVTFAFND